MRNMLVTEGFLYPNGCEPYQFTFFVMTGYASFEHYKFCFESSISFIKMINITVQDAVLTRDTEIIGRMVSYYLLRIHTSS